MSQHGAQALWGRETMAGVAAGGPAAGGRLEAELGYGMPVGGRLVGMPSFGIGASGHGRDYRLGYGLTVAQGGAMHFDLGVCANRSVWARELRSTALEAGSPRAGRGGSRQLPTALVAHNSNVQVVPVEGGGFSGIDATSAQIVQC